MSKKEDIMPHFVEVRGCINCEVSKDMKKRHGRPYGFDHELMARCLLFGCQNFGITLMRPMIDPEEGLEIIKSMDLTEQVKIIVVENFRAMYFSLGEYYKKVGVDIERIIIEIKMIGIE